MHRLIVNSNNNKEKNNHSDNDNIKQVYYPYLCEVNSYFPIIRGSFISICIGDITNAI